MLSLIVHGLISVPVLLPATVMRAGWDQVTSQAQARLRLVLPDAGDLDSADIHRLRFELGFAVFQQHLDDLAQVPRIQRTRLPSGYSPNNPSGEASALSGTASTPSAIG